MNNRPLLALLLATSAFAGPIACASVAPPASSAASAATAQPAQLSAGIDLAGMDRTVGTNVSISLSGDEADELRGYFAKLSEGGSVTMPLEIQMWGDEFGMCVDQFGVMWMVNIAQPQA